MSFRYFSMQHSEENKQCLNFQQKSVEMAELLHCNAQKKVSLCLTCGCLSEQHILEVCVSKPWYKYEKNCIPHGCPALCSQVRNYWIFLAPGIKSCWCQKKPLILKEEATMLSHSRGRNEKTTEKTKDEYSKLSKCIFISITSCLSTELIYMY